MKTGGKKDDDGVYCLNSGVTIVALTNIILARSR
jgi:hypothetical protein